MDEDYVTYHHGKRGNPTFSTGSVQRFGRSENSGEIFMEADLNYCELARGLGEDQGRWLVRHLEEVHHVFETSQTLELPAADQDEDEVA